MKNNHILETQQFSKEALIDLFLLARKMKMIVRAGGSNTLKNKIMATLFYEPSTRTRLSFETAMHRLGGKVISTENASDFSSVAKGETLSDTIRTVGQYANVIVLRHPESGSAKQASLVSPVPIINAGDGVGQHPTQALIDAFTIYYNLGRLDNLTIAMVGDLANGRTIRSLVYLLSKFTNNHFIFVAPEAVRIRDDILQYLNRHKISLTEMSDLGLAAPMADVLYVTRIQKERFGGDTEAFESVFGRYIVDNQIVELMPKKSIIMHPFPRVNELLTEVDDDPRAVYFNQIENGVYVRMALLLVIFGVAPI